MPLRIFVLFIMIFLVLGCNSGLKKVILKTYVLDDESKKQKIQKYTARIPKGYNLYTIEAGGEVGIEQRYYYQDSLVIYLSDKHMPTVNYENIDSAGLRGVDFEYRMGAKGFVDDSLILAGSDVHGLFWKERSIGAQCIGYMNVKKSEKEYYDRILNSFKRKGK